MQIIHPNESIHMQVLGGGGEFGSLNGTKKFNSGLQITTLEVNIYHYKDLK